MTTTKIKRILQLAVQALKGGEHEYTSGSINKAIFLLSVPMIAEMIMESLFAVVDVYFVAKVSVNAVATVGLTESVEFIVYSLAIGLSMAVTAIVSRRAGAKKYKFASDGAFQAIIIAVLAGISMGIGGFIYAEDILLAMGAEQVLIDEGIGYTKVMYAGNISVFLLFLINAIFRGAGDPAIAMRSLWLANGLNIILDPAFIFGWGPFPELGVMGAAVATTTGRSIGVLYQLYHLFNGSSVIRIAKENIVFHWQTIKEMISISAGGVAQFLIESASWIFLVRIVSNFGSEALAGYTIAFRIIVFTILPSWGMANAAATLVGQNLGAKKPDRAEKSVWRTALYNTAFLVLIAIVFFTLASPVVGFFTDDPAVMEVGIEALQIICTGYIFFAYGMVIGQAFNGAGDTRTPMWISLLAFWVFQIPMSYYLAIELGWGSTGVFWCISIAHSFYAIIAIVLFKRGKWKLKEVT